MLSVPAVVSLLIIGVGLFLIINAIRKYKRKTARETAFHNVHRILSHLGFDLLKPGYGPALALLYSGYTAGEVASHFVVLTLARDVKEVPSRFIEHQAHGLAVLEALKELKATHLLREKLWANDANAITHLSFLSESTEQYIRAILSDPVTSKIRVARCRLDCRCSDQEAEETT